MVRAQLLDLAARGHRLPIATDLILHECDDVPAVRRDGGRLGAVIVETAKRFGSPLAFPLMDLRLEKAELLRFFDVAAGEVERFHFTAAPSAERRHEFARWIRAAEPGAHVAAGLGAVRHVAAQPGLVPIGMCIGPFSLTTKLMADPITAVCMAGAGIGAEEDAGVALLEACVGLATECVLAQVERSLAAGARAVFVAEPAANQVYFSPLQLAEDAGIFERCVLGPNRRIAEVLGAHGAGLMFHCCGEITDGMLAGFCALDPCLLSLGSSRKLWEDAARVPRDIVLYGNLPSKLFYSDDVMPLERVLAQAEELAARMAACGHPFVLGTECDTLHVAEHLASISAKVDALTGRPAARHR